MSQRRVRSLTFGGSAISSVCWRLSIPKDEKPAPDQRFQQLETLKFLNCG
jgi:hypothetical protein